MLVGTQELLKLFIMCFGIYTKTIFLSVSVIFYRTIYCYCNMCHLLIVFSNESYIACIRLAVMDYNAHAERPVARNKEGDIVYHRKYKKQTKKWDITPVRCPKKYSYMENLVADIIRLRE